MSQATFKHDDSVPNPDSGYTRVYVKTDGKLYRKDSAGVETEVGSGVVEFLDSTFRITDDGTPTKKIAFQASGITAATTRTITMPDKNVTLDDAADTRPPTAHGSAAHSGAIGTASQISDFDTEVSNNTDVAANTSARHTRSHAIDGTSDHSAASDTTNFNASSTAHGLCPKLSNVSTEYLSGTGVFSTPAGGGYPEFQFFGDQLMAPVNSDWAVNALAGYGPCTNNAAVYVVRFDDTTEEGVGFILRIPTGATNLVLGVHSRAETAPAGTRTVGLKLYQRGLRDNNTVESWTAGLALTDISIPTNEYWQYDSQTISLATLGATAGEITQFELTRVNPSAGTELTGDWTLMMLRVSFT